MLPLYDTISKQWRRQMTFHRFIYVNLSWRHEYCGLFSLEYRGVTWYFVDNEHYFARGRLYGEGDDGERFGFFSRAVLDLLPLLDEMPQVIHCNDWQTALVPVYRQDFTGPGGTPCGASARCSLFIILSTRASSERIRCRIYSAWIGAGMTAAPWRWTAA